MNRHLPLLLLTALLLPSPARAHCGKCGMGDDHAAPPAGAPAVPGAGAEAPKPVPGSGSSPKSAFRPMGGGQTGGAAASLPAARNKFASTVEGYVSSRAEEGLWSLKDEKGRLRKLAFVSADKVSVVETGPGRYTGTAKFREGKRPVDVEMTVEASGQFWKVVDARFAPPPQKKN